MERREIQICKCLPAAQQLLACGLFPCAPKAPSLAVDISLLQFTSALFLRLHPNVTSFCETLEFFLEVRGYKLNTRVSFMTLVVARIGLIALPQESLRRRFGNALLWYTNLVNVTNHHVHEYIKHSRSVSGSQAVHDGGYKQDIPGEMGRNKQADGEILFRRWSETALSVLCLLHSANGWGSTRQDRGADEWWFSPQEHRYSCE